MELKNKRVRSQFYKARQNLHDQDCRQMVWDDCGGSPSGSSGNEEAMNVWDVGQPSKADHRSLNDQGGEYAIQRKKRTNRRFKR